jgi:hypothetical protein
LRKFGAPQAPQAARAAQGETNSLRNALLDFWCWRAPGWASINRKTFGTRSVVLTTAIALVASEYPNDLLADHIGPGPKLHRHLHSYTFTATDQANQDVLRTEAIVVEHAGLFLGRHKNTPGSIREALKHFATFLATA